MKPLKDKVITFRVEERQYNQLHEIAEEKDRPIAYIVNKICEEYLIENERKADIVFSYRLKQQQKNIENIYQYSKENIEKIKKLENFCQEYKCTIFQLIDFLLQILKEEDLERIPAEFSSGYLHEKYGIKTEE